MRRFCAVLACLVASAPAFAGEQDSPPRLAVGGFDLGMAERRAELLGSGPLSLGTVSAPRADGHLAVGGYLAYVLGDARLSSSLTGDGLGNSADLSAAYSGALLGTPGVTALKLGYDWGGPATFSLNTSQPSYDLLDPARSSLSLSLSWSHDVTPGLSLGGFATARRAQPIPDQAGQSDIHVGAGVGVKF
jgi:hypothetical protein